MLFKIIIFVTAAIPLILFVRSVFFRGRPNRVSAAVAEFKRNVDLAVWIVLILIGVIVAVALGHMVWTWWAP